MAKPKIERPTVVKGTPTAEQLKTWHEQLKRYESALQKWDEYLQSVEQMIEDGEGCFCDEGTCNIHPDQDCGEPPVDAGTQSEIDWLETLYKLPDRRRKKK